VVAEKKNKKETTKDMVARWNSDNREGFQGWGKEVVLNLKLFVSWWTMFSFCVCAFNFFQMLLDNLAFVYILLLE
jgi:hypothetical protein